MRRARSIRHCLIIEDEVLVGMDMEDGLREAGFDVRWVASAPSASAILATDCPDVVVLDVMQRATPCTALLRELKRRRIPFVVHTGYPDRDLPDDLDGAPRLSKPAEIPSLLAAIETALTVRTGPSVGLFSR